jgi:hypothetical protein
MMVMSAYRTLSVPFAITFLAQRRGTARVGKIAA